MGDIRVASLLFADDIVLLTSFDRDLQCPLEQIAAECDAVGSVDCSVQVGGRGVIQVAYLRVLFMSDGKKDCKIDRRLGALAAVMRGCASGCVSGCE